MPIIAVLMSILMIPCYCYSCGPMSGPYWAWERDKLAVYNQRLILQLQSQYSRPPQMVIDNNRAAWNGGLRMRSALNVNGYGRM